MKRWAIACFLAVSLAIPAMAQATGNLTGTVLDQTGAAVPGVQIIAVSGSYRSSQMTGPQGDFEFTGLPAGVYQVTARKTGFSPLVEQTAVRTGATAQLSLRLGLPEQMQSVMVRGGAVKGAKVALSPAQVFEASQSVRVIGRDQINALSPVSGAAQILTVAPGINVTGFGDTGATKSTITLNGIQQGWGGYGGFTTAGDVGITFDGIPVADPATGLWQSNMFPQGALINSTSVTYGPGSPVDRWYNNVAGGVEFTPIQPANHMHFSLSQTYGSYNQETTNFDFTTGTYKHWSAVFGGGHGSGNNYRISPDGFKNPEHDYAFFGKAIRDFSNGTFSIGYYYSDAEAYRAQVIPVNTVPGLTMDGTPTGAPYSQQASGFYATVPFGNYEKYDTNQLGLLYANLNLDLDPTTVLHGQSWYELIHRLHFRMNDVYNPGPQVQEWNNPFTKAFGQQLWLAKTLPFNTFTVGGYFIHTLYNSRNNFHDTGTGALVNIGAKIRSSLFNQDQYAAFFQDQIRPVSWLTITPGARYLNTLVVYSNQVLNDFVFQPGVVLSSHCYLNGLVTSTPGNVKVQSSACDAKEQRGGWEPSLNISIRPTEWLNLYGGYDEELRTPALGGGGGMFQSVDPASYRLSTAEYSQAGAKVHFLRVGPVTRLLFGANYFQLLFKNQELDRGLANGDTIYATANSRYKGLDWFFDANPSQNLGLFLNGTFERAAYTNWFLPNLIVNGTNQGGGVNFSNLPVPYVPQNILNVGGSYTWMVSENVVVEPRLWYQFTGTQTIFDNNVGTPSQQTMPNFGTLNFGVNVPINRFDLRLTALNLLNKQYNEYEFVSSGGYFGAGAGDVLAYPGAPFSLYATVGVHF